MTTTQTDDGHTRTIYPPDEWLHHIEFPDSGGMADDDCPVHVACRPVRFNGVKAAAGIVKAPITVTAGADDKGEPDATVVSFVVHADDVEWAERDGVRYPHAIGGLRVLSPADRPWVEEEDAEPVVRVHVFARTVSFPSE